jgi:hypothetical protein
MESGHVCGSTTKNCVYCEIQIPCFLKLLSKSCGVLLFLGHANLIFVTFTDIRSPYIQGMLHEPAFLVEAALGAHRHGCHLYLVPQYTAQTGHKGMQEVRDSARRSENEVD